MPVAAPRSRLAFLLLAAALLLVAAAVMAILLSLHAPVLAGIVAVAGGAGVLGGGFAYSVAREGEGELAVPEAGADALSASTVMPIAVPRAPMRIHAMPVADLPPAYLAAVMKGVRAHGAKHQARVLPEVELRQ